MANKKFSEFDTKTNPSDVEFVVGYDGTDNVKIAPSDLAPAVTVPVGADPQAEISGAKVNGTATTFMRSDAAPPLSDTGVTANTYGDSSNVPQITVDAKGRITNIQTEPVSGGSSGFTSWTTLDNSAAAAEFIDWDPSATGGQYNIIVKTGAGSAGTVNKIRVTSSTGIADGTEGWILVETALETSYRLPLESQGSFVGCEGLIQNGTALGAGPKPELFRYVYRAANTTFYYTKVDNLETPVYPPGQLFPTNSLVAVYDPNTFNGTDGATITNGQAWTNSLAPNTSFPTLFALQPSSPNQLFIWYDGVTSQTLPQPMFFTGTSDVSSSGFYTQPIASQSNTTTSCLYMRGPHSVTNGTYGGLIDFKSTGGNFDETLYVYRSGGDVEFRMYDPNVFFNYPPINSNFQAGGGTDFLNQYYFIAWQLDYANNTATLHVACNDSKAWAATNGAGPWYYETGAIGQGASIQVDASGIWKEQVSGFTLSDPSITTFAYGNNAGTTSSESSGGFLGHLAIYTSLLSDAAVKDVFDATSSLYMP